MIDIPTLMGAGVIGSSAGHRRRSRTSQKNGLWYWLVVAPVKYCMIAVGVMLVISFALVIGMIVAIPWIIVRLTQKKSLKPDFLSKPRQKQPIQEAEIVK